MDGVRVKDTVRDKERLRCRGLGIGIGLGRALVYATLTSSRSMPKAYLVS